MDDYEPYHDDLYEWETEQVFQDGVLENQAEAELEEFFEFGDYDTPLEEE